MNKQVKKLSKKILVLGLATSIIFTSCFSYKKINAHATSVVAGLGAYTLYEICLYIGGLAVTTLGLGVAYENRDEIAEFGKSVIDSMSDLSSKAWLIGSHSIDGDYVYGTEALEEVQGTEWTVIQGGGQSPKNDNDDDGDEDLDDREIELNLNGYFLTQAGINLFQNHIKPIYDKWVNGEENIVDNHLGIFHPTDIVHEDLYYSAYKSWDKTEVRDRLLSYSSDLNHFVGYHRTADGYYISYHGEKSIPHNYRSIDLFVTSTPPVYVNYIDYSDNTLHRGIWCQGAPNNIKEGRMSIYYNDYSYNVRQEMTFFSNAPWLSTLEEYNNFLDSGVMPIPEGQREFHRVADWIADDEHWKGYLEDIATSLRSLQDLSNLAKDYANNLLETKPTVNVAGDTLNEYITNTYSPITNVYITNPTYYPATNTTPKLDISVFPNYDIYIENGGGAEQPPSDDGTDEIPEIDLDGLLSIFNILFYLIMIIVMLIYLFLSCLAFIVMIFRIPASSTMLPEDMVLGYEHLKTIMIPGMNISIYGFAMALIYLFIIFAVIKLIRLEINDFKFPRSYK